MHLCRTLLVACSYSRAIRFSVRSCILTMDAFTPNEPIYTFDNQLSFAVNTGRNAVGIQKTQTAPGDNGVPPLYSYYGGGPSLWKNYFSTPDEAKAAVDGATFFSSNRPSTLVGATSGRHLLGTSDPENHVNGLVLRSSTGITYTVDYIGECLNKDGTAYNRWRLNSTTNLNQPAMCTSPSSCSSKAFDYTASWKACRCMNSGVNGATQSAYCTGSWSVCKFGVGCYQNTGVSGTASILAA